MTIPIEQLRAAGLGDQVEALSTAVAEYLDDDRTLDRVDSNVAVVSDPFAGRTALLDYAAELLDDSARRIRLSSVVTSVDELPEIPSDRALLLENCHYLYRRCIGGFDVLDEFLERLAMTNTLVVTTWNRYAWQYLSAVRRLAESFPLSIRIPPLDADQIEAVVAAHEESLPAFVDAGGAGRLKTVELVRYPLALGGRTIAVPLVRLNPSWVASWWTLGEDESIEAVVYEKLRRSSHGNPGIATSLWDQSVREGEDGRRIAPGDIERLVPDWSDLTDEAAFLLSLIVSMEAVDREQLATMLGEDAIGTAIQMLANEGVVAVEGETVRLTPAGLHPAVAELERRRLLW